MQSRDALASCSQPALFLSLSYVLCPNAPGTRARIDYGVGAFFNVSPFAITG